MLSRIFKRRGYLALAPHHGNLAAVPAAFQWDTLWTKWHWRSVFPDFIAFVVGLRCWTRWVPKWLLRTATDGHWFVTLFWCGKYSCKWEGKETRTKANVICSPSADTALQLVKSIAERCTVTSIRSCRTHELR
jgi:hypothetical protein